MTDASAKGTPAWLGAVNDRAGLSVLLEHGPLTRQRICELVGVSKPTASLIMQRLIAGGFIEEQGRVSRSAGPSAVVYAARLDRRLGVAVDLDAAELRARVVDAAGTEHPVARRSLPAGAGARDAVGELRDAIDAACAAAGADAARVRTVCLGIPGYVDPGRNGELFSETLPGWPTTGLQRTLEAALEREVLVENDVDLAALAERTLGSVREAFALLWLGNGVGAAFDAAGGIHRGSFGGAGEIGFLPVPAVAAALDPDARILQDLVGAGAVVRLARAHGIDASRAALDDAPGAAALLAELADRVALAALPVLAVLDPAVLVLGGPTAALGGAALAAAVRERIRAVSRWDPEVRAAAVVREPVLAGASVLAQRRVRAALLDEVAAVGAA
ncbi:ROK family transcriptional regulator [Agromyces sp. SYSU T00194]|uniref:ROK family transcriptional regulator n=1 Tax=Agromyces chitinivorans TaxID=3158560 RepID=UPI0033919043